MALISKKLSMEQYSDAGSGRPGFKDKSVAWEWRRKDGGGAGEDFSNSEEETFRGTWWSPLYKGDQKVSSDAWGSEMKKIKVLLFKKLTCVFTMYSWALLPKGALSSCFIFNLCKPYSPLTTSHSVWLFFFYLSGREEKRKKTLHSPDH